MKTRKPDYQTGQRVLVYAYHPHPGGAANKLKPPRHGTFVRYASPEYHTALVQVDGVGDPVHAPADQIGTVPGTPVVRGATVKDTTGQLEIVVDVAGRETDDEVIVVFENGDDAMTFAVHALNVAMRQWEEEK